MIPKAAVRICQLTMAEHFLAAGVLQHPNAWNAVHQYCIVTDDTGTGHTGHIVDAHVQHCPATIHMAKIAALVHTEMVRWGQTCTNICAGNLFNGAARPTSRHICCGLGLLAIAQGRPAGTHREITGCGCVEPTDNSGPFRLNWPPHTV